MRVLRDSPVGTDTAVDCAFCKPVNFTTEAFQRYRLCARLIWNLFFLPDPALANWDGREEFDRLRRVLFEALVARKLDVDVEASRFAVVPRADSGIPIKIEQPRAGDRNHYWDHPLRSIRPGDATLEFIDYFDWNPLGCLDFRYVRVRIRAFALHDELVGREALLEVEHVVIVSTADNPQRS